MAVLVTGGTGFVGGRVARLLTQRGEPVRALVRPGSRRDNLAHLGVEFVEGDLQRYDSLREAVQGCRVVYHIAADYRLWARDPQEIYRSNVEGTQHLMAACKCAAVERVVYTSSVGALGIPPDGDGTEDTPVTLADMVGDYKRSKFLAEREAGKWVNEGLPVVIVNPSTPIGPGDIKPTPTGKIIVDFLNGKMPAFLDTGLNLVHVDDVAEGHLLAAERGKVGRKYILGNRNVSLEQMLQMLAEIVSRPAPRVKIPYGVALTAAQVNHFFAATLLRREPSIPLEGVKMARKKMYFDASRAVRELGLPQTPIEQALAEAVDWYRENGYIRTRISEPAAVARNG